MPKAEVSPAFKISKSYQQLIASIVTFFSLDRIIRSPKLFAPLTKHSKESNARWQLVKILLGTLPLYASLFLIL